MRNTKKPIQLYRGTTQQHSDYAGPVGEITVDTEKYTVVVQNGVTGGVPLAREDTVVSLTNRIAAEESARETADTALQESITDEASARETADNALQKKDTALQKSITDEASARESADTALQSVQAAHTSELSDIKTSMAALEADSVHKIGDETISGVKTFTQTIAGTAAAAEKLATARTITLSGAASGSVAFDGSADATLEVSIGVNQGAVIGEIRWFAMSQPPEGWLVCNGAAVGRATYPELFAAIGTTYGSGDGSTTFNLPNLMGKVPWGSMSVGTVIDAGAPDISGHFSATDNVCLNGYADKDTPKVFAKNDGCFSFIDGSGGRALVNVIQVGNYSDNRRVTFSASSSNNIYGNSDTVQPPALCLLPCIRYE